MIIFVVTNSTLRPDFAVGIMHTCKYLFLIFSCLIINDWLQGLSLEGQVMVSDVTEIFVFTSACFC